MKPYTEKLLRTIAIEILTGILAFFSINTIINKTFSGTIYSAIPIWAYVTATITFIVYLFIHKFYTTLTGIFVLFYMFFFSPDSLIKISGISGILHNYLTIIIFAGFFRCLYAQICQNQRKGMTHPLPVFIILFIFNFLIIKISIAEINHPFIRNSFIQCQSNLKNTATSLEHYKSNNGSYPDNLSRLQSSLSTRCYTGCFRNFNLFVWEVSDINRYVELSHRDSDRYNKIYGITTAPYEYRVSDDRQTFTLYCKGNNHTDLEVPPNFPQYDSIRGLSAK